MSFDKNPSSFVFNHPLPMMIFPSGYEPVHFPKFCQSFHARLLQTVASTAVLFSQAARLLAAELQFLFQINAAAMADPAVDRLS